MKHVMVWIYLSEYYNPDEKGDILKVEEKKILMTADEIALNLAGGGTLRENPRAENITGIWHDSGKRYLDKIRILEFDVVDNKENRDWVINYCKEILLERFKQEAIYVKFISRVEPVLIKVERNG